MLRRSVVRCFAFEGGAPRVEEVRAVQREAQDYVDRWDYSTVTHARDELTVRIPAGWVGQLPHSRLRQDGTLLRDYVFQPQNEASSYFGVPSTQHFVVSACKLDETQFISGRTPNPNPGKFLNQWLEDKQRVAESMKAIHFSFFNEHPCTHMEETPSGAYAWSKQHYIDSNPEIVYWRLFFAGDMSRYYVAAYSASPAAMKDHLAQRWYGLNLIQSVEWM